MRSPSEPSTTTIVSGRAALRRLGFRAEVARQNREPVAGSDRSNFAGAPPTLGFGQSPGFSDRQRAAGRDEERRRRKPSVVARAAGVAPGGAAAAGGPGLRERDEGIGDRERHPVEVAARRRVGEREAADRRDAVDVALVARVEFLSAFLARDDEESAGLDRLVADLARRASAAESFA